MLFEVVQPCSFCLVRACPEDGRQQGQASRAPGFRAGVPAGRPGEQGLIVLRYGAAHAQRDWPGGRSSDQTAPSVCQAEAQIASEEEHHHHLRHRQSKDELQESLTETVTFGFCDGFFKKKKKLEVWVPLLFFLLLLAETAWNCAAFDQKHT